MRCEDYPCCGHEPGGCPDPELEDRGYWPLPCVECGGLIKRGEEQHNAPSMHATCCRAYLSSFDDYYHHIDDYVEGWDE